MVAKVARVAKGCPGCDWVTEQRGYVAAGRATLAKLP